jgi:hypothetical protein
MASPCVAGGAAAGVVGAVDAGADVDAVGAVVAAAVVVAVAAAVAAAGRLASGVSAAGSARAATRSRLAVTLCRAPRLAAPVEGTSKWAASRWATGTHAARHMRRQEEEAAAAVAVAVAAAAAVVVAAASVSAAAGSSRPCSPAKSATGRASRALGWPGRAQRKNRATWASNGQCHPRRKASCSWVGTIGLREHAAAARLKA